MAARFLATDWAASTLGALETWPQSLRVAVGICLNSRFPMFVWWGPELVNIYNDAYVPVLGARHPEALGRPAKDVWSDIWPTIRSQVDAVLRRGDATWNERAELIMERHGYPEVTSFTWSYSPIIDEQGGVGGLFCACIEETPRMHAEQQRDLLLSQVQSERARLAEAFMHSPAFIGILHGPDHQIEFFNDRFYQLVGRRGLAGKPVREALPEVVSQGFVDILDRVYRTGEHYVGTAGRIELRRRPDRGLEEAFVDFVYQPLRDVNGEINGILVHGVDITEQNRRAVRDRFLLALDVALRPLTSQSTIVGECTRLLGTHMGVDRCAFSLVEPDEDSYHVLGEYNRHTTALAGRRQLSDFGEEAHRLLRLDAAYVVGDIDTHQPAPGQLDAYRRMMIHAVIAVPIIEDGRLAAILSVTQSTPRDWRPEEVTLVRHVAQRCHESLERARVARDLAESEARFRNMADFAPVMIWQARSDGASEYLNRRWLQFTGQSAPEAAGFGWLQALHPADRADVRERYSAALREREPVTLQYRLRRHDGEYRWCADMAAPRRGADGTFLGYVGSVVDITDRRRVEESLAAEKDVLEMVATGTLLPQVLEEITRKLERQSPHGALFAILIVQDDGDRLVVGAAPGMPPPWRDAVAAEPLDPAIGPWPSDEEGWRGLSAAADAAGLHAAHATRITGGEGYLLGIVASFYRERRLVSDRDRDLARLGARLAGIVVERHRVDRRIGEALRVEQEARAQAEKAGRAKDEFLATLSHELRTPLNAVLGWVSVLKTGTAGSDTVAHGIEVIERNARSQARIIDDLLDMSAIISGKVRLNVRPVQLAPIVMAALETARPGADAKQITLQPVIDTDNDLVVLGDPERLQQILWNLLSNAVKFTPREGCIHLSLQRVASGVEVTVSDNGEGIDPSFLPFVFDRFRQADSSTTRRHSGLGLGLSIVTKLIELHGGSVRVASEGIGFGASFVVSLPLAALKESTDSVDAPLDRMERQSRDQEATLAGVRSALASAGITWGRDAGVRETRWPSDGRGERVGAEVAPDIAPEVAPEQVAPAEESFAGRRILVVDDEEDARELVCKLLADAGAKVDTAQSAAEAIRLLREARYDVLVSDIGMPGDDGYALLRRLRAAGPAAGGDTPALALTAYASVQDRVRALRAGFNLHLAKPVDSSELLAAVASLASRR
jgi:PAS domain S-box-containing protein